MSELIKIATIHSPFSQKFGIPRQCGMENDLLSEIIFEKPFNNSDAIKGIEEYSHLWLIWGFSENKWDGRLTVNPPRLGGKESKGVFATRSSFRPNSMGLSCVKLLQVKDGENGPVLVITGADMLDGTPIYDIKPYLPYADMVTDARGSFGQQHSEDRIDVVDPDGVLCKLPEHLHKSAKNLISMDPRAAFNKKEDHIYGIALDIYDIRFVVKDNVAIIVDVVSTADEDFKKIK